MFYNISGSTPPPASVGSTPPPSPAGLPLPAPAASVVVFDTILQLDGESDKKVEETKAAPVEVSNEMYPDYLENDGQPAFKCAECKLLFIPMSYFSPGPRAGTYINTMLLCYDIY